MRIIDNFFKDPYKVRNIALKGNYLSAENFRWPGYRWNPPEDFQKFYRDNLSNILNEKFHISSLRFQYIDKLWVGGMCHRDFPYKYTCITYLTPEPPSNSGTEVYGVESPEDGERGPIKQIFYQSDRGMRKRWKFKRDIEDYNSLFKDPCVVSNKFNRTLIFDSNRFHRAQNFFGNDLRDSRLTLISFIYGDNK